MKKFWFLSLVFLLILSCATSGRKEQDSDEQQGAAVEVENDNYLDMTIYLLRGAQRFRLGTVTGHSTKVFPIPAYVVASSPNLRFLANPVGSNQNPISQDISVSEGDLIRLRIPPY